MAGEIPPFPLFESFSCTDLPICPRLFSIRKCSIPFYRYESCYWELVVDQWI